MTMLDLHIEVLKSSNEYKSIRSYTNEMKTIKKYNIIIINKLQIN